MTIKLMFDTLSYAKILQDGGVENADIHANSLASILSQNMYTKDEVDMRLERAIRQFEKTLDKRLHEFQTIQDERFHEFKITQHELELRFEKTMQRYLITTISVLGTLIVLVGAVSTFAHAIFHTLL